MALANLHARVLTLGGARGWRPLAAAGEQAAASLGFTKDTEIEDHLDPVFRRRMPSLELQLRCTTCTRISPTVPSPMSLSDGSCSHLSSQPTSYQWERCWRSWTAGSALYETSAAATTCRVSSRFGSCRTKQLMHPWLVVPLRYIAGDGPGKKRKMLLATTAQVAHVFNPETNNLWTVASLDSPHDINGGNCSLAPDNDEKFLRLVMYVPGEPCPVCRHGTE